MLADPGIVRNRGKIAAAIDNAKALLAVQREFGSFDIYIWRFAGGRPIQNQWRSAADVPSATANSRKMSLDLKEGASGS